MVCLGVVSCVVVQKMDESSLRALRSLRSWITVQPASIRSEVPQISLEVSSASSLLPGSESSHHFISSVHRMGGIERVKVLCSQLRRALQEWVGRLIVGLVLRMLVLGALAEWMILWIVMNRISCMGSLSWGWLCAVLEDYSSFSSVENDCLVVSSVSREVMLSDLVSL